MFGRRRKLRKLISFNASDGTETVERIPDYEDQPQSSSSTTPCSRFLVEGATSTRTTLRYTVEKKQRLEEWKAASEKIFNSYLSDEAPDAGLTCFLCGIQHVTLYRCQDCCEWQKICRTCLQSRHNYPHLHCFEEWKNKAFMLCTSLENVMWSTSHQCETSYLKRMVLVDEKGRQHNRKVRFCSCEHEAVTLTKLRLWPSTVKYPQVAFSFDLLEWMNSLHLESHVSVKSFCEALKARSSKFTKPLIDHKVKSIYKLLITETFEEFRHFIHKKEDQFENDTACPPCFNASSIPK